MHECGFAVVSIYVLEIANKALFLSVYIANLSCILKF